MGKLWILLWYWIHPLFHLSFVVSPKKKKKKKTIMYLIHSKNIHSNHFNSIQFIWSNQIHFDPILTTSVHSVNFGPLQSVQSTLVHIGPFSPLWSFALLGPFRCTSVPQVNLSPFNQLQSFALFGPVGTLQSIRSFCSIRPLWSPRFSPFSPFGPLRSNLDHLVQLSPFGIVQSILFTLVYCSQ